MYGRPVGPTCITAASAWVSAAGALCLYSVTQGNDGRMSEKKKKKKKRSDERPTKSSSPQGGKHVPLRANDDESDNESLAASSICLSELHSGANPNSGPHELAAELAVLQQAQESTATNRGSALRGTAPSKKPAADDAYRADVDGLRAIAVCSVIVYHMNKKWLPGGFTGVDVFFVISGFVVSGSLLRHQSPTVSDFLSGFYSRRVKRLTPSLAVTVFATSIAFVLLPTDEDTLGDYLTTGQFALFGWANKSLSRRIRTHAATLHVCTQGSTPLACLHVSRSPHAAVLLTLATGCP